MNCPNCRAPNPDGARFCENCGQALERACPRCGEPVSPAARFCRSCGGALAAPGLPAEPAPAGLDLHQQLLTLQRAELVREAARAPELEYIFHHTLTQEVAYQSLLLHQRRDYHSRVAETLEQLYPDRLEEFAAVLGHHFDAADDLRALRYYTLAGDRAFRLYANVEAEAHYSHVLEIAQRAGLTPNSENGLPQIYERRGRALELNGAYERALANYEALLTAARENNDRPLELAALMLMATLRSVQNSVYDPVIGQALSDEALPLARALGDRAAEAKILWNMLLVNTFNNRGEAAVEYGERSLALARELGLRQQLAATLNDLSRAYGGLGNVERGKELNREATALWRELGNLPLLADSLSTANTFLFTQGEYETVVRNGEEALQISRAAENLWGQAFSQFWVGSVYAERGEPGHALEVMRDCLQAGMVAGFAGAQGMAGSQLALLYGELGVGARGIELLNEIQGQLKGLFAPFYYEMIRALAYLQVGLGQLADAEAILNANREDMARDTVAAQLALPVESALALAQGDAARAVAAADEHLDYLRYHHTRWSVPRALLMKGQALLAHRRPAEARQVLAEARTEAERLGSRRRLWQILMSLSQIEAQEGREAEAQALRRQAREIVAYMAAHIDSPELRQSFLNQPEVRATEPDPR